MPDELLRFRFVADTSQFSAGVSKVKAELKSLDASVGGVNQKMTGVGSSFDDSAKKVETGSKRIRNALTRVQSVAASVITSLTVVAGIGIFAKLVKSVIDFDSAFAQVRKTVEGTQVQFRKLREQLLRMSESLPIAREEIARVASIAGQLGVKVQDISDFTKVVIQLATASADLTFEDAALELAKFTNVMRTSRDQTGAVASVIIELGNNFAALEGDILRTAQIMSGMVKTLDLAEPDVLALGAAIQAVGVRADAGGRALGTFVLRIVQGGEFAEKFRKVLELTNEEFTKLAETDPGEIIRRFVNVLGEDLPRATRILQDLGITEKRQVGTLLALAGAVDTVNEAFVTAREEFERDTARIEEFNKFLDTFQNRFIVLSNRLLNEFSPAIESVLNLLLRLLQVLGDLFATKPVRIAIDLVISKPLELIDQLIQSLQTRFRLSGELREAISSLENLISRAIEKGLDIPEDVLRKLDEFKARLTSIIALGGDTDDLIKLSTEFNKFSRETQDLIRKGLGPLSEGVEKVSESAKKGAEFFSDFTEEQQRYLEKVLKILHPQDDLISKLEVLDSLGASTSVKFFVLRNELKELANNADVLGIKLLPPIKGLVDLVRNLEEANREAKEFNRTFGPTGTFVEGLSRGADFVDVLSTGAPVIAEELRKANQQADEFMRRFGGSIRFIRDFFVNLMAAKKKLSAAKKFTQAWMTALGNVVSDFSRALSDLVFNFRSFGESLKRLARDFATAVLRIFVQRLFAPLFARLARLFGRVTLGGGIAVLRSVFGGGGLFGGTVGGALTGAFSLRNLFGGGIIGSIAGGAAGAIGGSILGGILTGQGASGGLAALAGLLGPAAPFALPALGVALIVGIFKGIFSRSAFEKATDEVVRDFNISGVSEDVIKNFVKNVLGLSEKQFKGIRKDILSSPLFFQQVLLPHAKAQGPGAVEALIQSFSRLRVSGAVGRGAANAGIPFTIDPATGDFIFDLSEAVRRAVRFGDFSLFNEQFATIFKNSLALREVLPDITRLFAETSEEARIAADTYQRLVDAFGVDVVEKATDQQRLLLASLLDLREAPTQVADALQDMVDQMEFLRSVGATDEEILQLLGPAMRDLVDQAMRLGNVEIPPEILDILSIGEKAPDPDPIIEMAAAFGLLGDNAAAFRTGFLSVSEEINNLNSEASELFGRAVALFNLFSDQGLSTLEAQTRVWNLLGDAVIDLFNQFVDLGIEIPPRIQEMIDWGVANGFARINVDGHAEAVDDLVQSLTDLEKAQIRGSQTAEDIISSTHLLSAEIQGFSNTLLLAAGIIDENGNVLADQDRVLSAQLFVWDQFKDRIIEAFNAQVRLGLAVDPFIQLIVDWAKEQGLLNENLDGTVSLADELVDTLNKIDLRFADSFQVLQLFRQGLITLEEAMQAGFFPIFTADGERIVGFFQLVGETGTDAFRNISDEAEKTVSVFQRLLDIENALLGVQEKRRLAGLVRTVGERPIEQLIPVVQQALGLNADLARDLLQSAISQFGLLNISRAVELLRLGDFSSLGEAVQALLGDVPNSNLLGLSPSHRFSGTTREGFAGPVVVQLTQNFNGPADAELFKSESENFVRNVMIPAINNALLTNRGGLTTTVRKVVS